jgi:hypothetical protein
VEPRDPAPQDILSLDLQWDPTYATDSPNWGQWFETKHDAQWQSIKVHLDGLSAMTT